MSLRSNPTLRRAVGPFDRWIRNGDRSVLWPAPALGFGNHLYLWLHAYLARREGRDVAWLIDDAMDPWLETFPRLRSLSIPRSDVRLRDRRDVYHHQVIGSDFTVRDLEAFIADVLLESNFGDRLRSDVARQAESSLPPETVLNIRRGDYYSVPAFRGRYGFDISEYVGAALTHAPPVERILVISDDPQWCRTKLAWLQDHAPVRIAPASDGPVENLQALGLARRLILTNSSFSYWGAHLSNVVHGDNHSSVVAPWFHRRDILDGRAWQLDPRWTVVTDIPGGWDG